MKLLNERIDDLLQSLDIDLEEAVGARELTFERLEGVQETLTDLRQAIKDAVVDAYIEARGERK